MPSGKFRKRRKFAEQRQRENVEKFAIEMANEWSGSRGDLVVTVYPRVFRSRSLSYFIY